uniref:Enoyl reductase (ER) domain-containing protein n=1 Tax=Chromera velia CCMP2878 TaxID=1169474 RepID=A0A0G4HQ23_9ALVE|eukprot:Cvel_30029.t1-p1 / transcript=Cvel_30029.t1 / gene=Cvel_30029 / organism=Chromera_velia_CCMP2878 / gene_product=Reticulon-4-interacting protein 1 homolog,, putative / transcript_product=Reticulon-4-interacting protein 1 homolog,, putative / location=Cvel_scaffold4218:1453-3200(+) / protein_length=430 / sequence_SO=supercontig / SO=protein_coding / is_pseudo=false
MSPFCTTIVRSLKRIVPSLVFCGAFFLLQRQLQPSLAFSLRDSSQEPQKKTNMQAAVYKRTEPEHVSLVSKPIPENPKKGQLVCKVVCAGVNPVDAKGKIGDKLGESLQGFARRMIENVQVGFDFAGVVTQISSDCKDFAIGDEVFGTMPPTQGSFCEYVCAPEHQVAKKPANLSWQEAAAFPLVGLTSLQSLKIDNGLKSGQRLLVIGGSGGVGHMALQVGKALGAHVTTVCSGSNAEWVKSLGADEVVDYKEGNDAMMKHLRELASVSGPFDLCLDTVHSISSQDTSAGYEGLLRGCQLESGKPLLDGTYVTIGGPTSDWMRAGVKQLFGWNWFPKERQLFWIRFPHSQAALGELGVMADEGKVKPVVSHEFPFTEDGVRESFRQLMGRRTKGKIVLRMSEDPQGSREAGKEGEERGGEPKPAVTSAS